MLSLPVIPENIAVSYIPIDNYQSLVFHILIIAITDSIQSLQMIDVSRNETSTVHGDGSDKVNMVFDI